MSNSLQDLIMLSPEQSDGNYSERKLTRNIIHAGIDDATKCPCIGSIVIAGVIADEQTIFNWKKLGVKDSKLITSKKKLNDLARIIKETAIGFHIEKLEPEMIDNKCLNLNEWEMVTVLTIAKKLQRTARKRMCTIEKIYVDNWEVSEKLFKTRLKNIISCFSRDKKNHNNDSLKQDELGKAAQKYTIKLPKTLEKLPFIAEHRADENYTIVGAASILAKTTSDAEYKSLTRKYGNFGSGSPGDPKTRLFVWMHRKNPPPLIRTSWNTFKTLSVLDSIDDDPLKEILKKRVRKRQKNAIHEQHINSSI